jgi:hypothetical protein
MTPPEHDERFRDVISAISARSAFPLCDQALENRWLVRSLFHQLCCSLTNAPQPALVELRAENENHERDSAGQSESVAHTRFPHRNRPDR